MNFHANDAAPCHVSLSNACRSFSAASCPFHDTRPVETRPSTRPGIGQRERRVPIDPHLHYPSRTIRRHTNADCVKFSSRFSLCFLCTANFPCCNETMIHVASHRSLVSDASVHSLCLSKVSLFVFLSQKFLPLSSRNVDESSH